MRLKPKPKNISLSIESNRISSAASLYEQIQFTHCSTRATTNYRLRPLYPTFPLTQVLSAAQGVTSVVMGRYQGRWRRRQDMRRMGQVGWSHRPSL